jgi:hypothetical protein
MLRSALVNFYRNELKWAEDDNPMESIDLKMYMAGFRKKRAMNPDFNAKRAHPFSYKDLTKSNKYLDKIGTYESELFLIVSCMAFYLWLRIDEVLKIKSGAFLTHYEKNDTGGTFHTIRIACRKTNKEDYEGNFKIN